MEREQALRLFERSVLTAAAAAYGTSATSLRIFEGSEGCQNLVYAYEDKGIPKILRVSFRSDRSPAQIRSELDFVNYLADNAAGVARAVPSKRGELLERFEVDGAVFVAVSFLRGKGMRVPDNGYRYRDDAPISEYFRNWGVMLGRMHALSKDYVPPEGVVRRPDLLKILDLEPIEQRVPERFPRVRRKLATLLDELRALPRDGDGYGLIHADFNDGNFTVDYTSGAMTVFDFDDCCYGWFAYELASAWEGGVGRVMFQELAGRRAFMDSYFALVLEGYSQENTLADAWLGRLPLFLCVVQMQELVYYLQYIDDPNDEIQARLGYKIKCIVDDIPYLGFFSPVYNPERPFCE